MNKQIYINRSFLKTFKGLRREKMNMKGAQIIVSAVIAGIVMLFGGMVIQAQNACAGTKAKDVIEMKNTNAFATHKMGIVMFGHKKHTDAKPKGHAVACGECHHDKDHKPLTLKEGDAVQGCMECHKKPEKPKKEKGVSAADYAKLEREYYYGAVHQNCIDCHKKAAAGPVKCAECHPKKAK